MTTNLEIFKKVCVASPRYYWTYEKGYPSLVKHKGEPLKLSDSVINKMLTGEETLGLSPFVDDDNILYGGIDLDAHSKDEEQYKKELEDIKKDTLEITKELDKLGYSYFVNSSGSVGVHIRIYPPKPMNAKVMRYFLMDLQKRLFGEYQKHEVFPKQNTLKDTPKGFGNQMKSVLSLHPKYKKIAGIIKNGVVLDVNASLLFLTEFAEKMHTFKEIEFKVTDEQEQEHKKIKFTPEEIKEKNKDIPKYCAFIEELATKKEIPSGSGATRHDYLDGNVYKYCEQNNKPELLKQYMRIQNRDRTAFNDCENWGFECETIKKYVRKNKLNDGFYICKKCRTDKEKDYEARINEEIKEKYEIWEQIYNKNGILLKEKLKLTTLSRALSDNYYYKTTGEEKFDLLVYDNGVYVNKGKKHLLKNIHDICDGNVSNTQINEIIGKVERYNFTDLEQNKESTDLICVRNGILNIFTKELKPHSPDYLFTQQINWDYDPDAKCNKFFDFLKQTLEEKNIEIIQEMFGYCLLREYRFKKAFIFVGEPDTGKTTLLKILINFLSNKNISGVSLHKILVDKFAAASMRNKLLNFYDDLSFKDIKETGAFKIATGGGYMSGEKKFGDTFEFMNYAKLIFATNKISSVEDTDDDAYFKRWIILFFNNIVADDKKDLLLVDKLNTDEEMSGILNWALDGLKRLITNNKFSYTKTPEENKIIMERSSNTLSAFLQDCVIQNDGLWISKEDLYSIYSNYVLESGGQRISKEKFGRDLTKKSNFIIDGKKLCDKKNVTGWLNLEISNQGNHTFFENIYNKKNNILPNDGKFSLMRLIEKNPDYYDLELETEVIEDSKTHIEKVIDYVRLHTKNNNKCDIQKTINIFGEQNIMQMLTDGELIENPNGFLRVV